MLGDTPWHDMKKEMGAEVSRLISAYRTDQAGRRTRYVRNLEMYEGRKLGGYYGFGYGFGEGTDAGANTQDSQRLVRSGVSTAVANIYAPQKPKPQFQTLGATWDMRRRAYKLDRICEGIINQRQQDFINVWAFMADAGSEVALQGVACIKVTADTVMRRIDHQLIPYPDVFADPAEGRRPRNLFQREPILESVALAKWPKKAAAIRGAPAYEWYQGGLTDKNRVARMVELQYAWRLPFGPDKPGRWCAVIGGEVLEEGEWTAPFFPFVFLYWERHRDGVWGSGIADEGGDIARSQSDLHIRLGQRARVAAGKRIYYHSGTLPTPADLEGNDELTVIPVEPGEQFPQESLTPPFTPADVEYASSERRSFFDAIGISEVSAAARRERGIDSGVAMRTLNDTKAGRQLVKAQRYEQSFVDLAHQYVWRLRELADVDKNFAVKYPGGSLIRDIKWDDADPGDDESFSIQVAPASNLPHDPAGRQQMVQDMFGSGLISPETAKQLMGWPDFESELDIENAETDYVDSLIETYLDAAKDTWDMEEYQPPEGFIFKKPQALRRFASAWFRARIDQRALDKEERAKAEFSIGLLERWIKELDSLIKSEAEKQAELQQMMGQGAASPGGVPGGAPPMPGAQPPMPPMAA